MTSPGLGRVSAHDTGPANDPVTALIDAAVQRLAEQMNVSKDDPLAQLEQWFITPPAFSEEFNVTQPGGGLTLGANAVRTEICAYQLPPGVLGVLRFAAFSVANASDAPNVTFALLVDGGPVPGYASVIGSISPSLSLPKPMIRVVRGLQRVSIVATNALASTIQNVNALVAGWHWQAAALPKGAIARFPKAR